jgi:enoyl-CoA hydratase
VCKVFLNTEFAEDTEKKMAYENILYEKRDGIAFVTFNRPKVLNALNRKTVEELRDALLDARGDDAVRVLILRGAGEKSFVAGADIGELAQQTPVNGKEFSLFGQSVFRLLETMGKPSICAINGFALGGGCELALSCTIRVASKTAKLGQPEVKLGIIPGYGGTQRLARLCGKGAAQELCLTGEMISAEEALRIGLVNHIYEAEELLGAAEAMAKKIIANGPIAVKYTMEAIERGVEMPQEEGLFLEATLFGLSCATEDMREGTRAFLDKRKAEFKGR